MDKIVDYIKDCLKHNFAQMIILVVFAIVVGIMSYRAGVYGINDVPVAKVDQSADDEYVKAYNVRIGDYIIKLSSLDDIVKMLEIAKAEYDPDGIFSIELRYDSSKSFDEMTAKVVRANKEANMVNLVSVSGTGGVGTSYYPENKIEDGIAGLGFAKDVEIIETYARKEELVEPELAARLITEVKEESTVYEVQPGDCIALIAQELNMSVDKLIELNGFESENDIIRVGDELLVTVPEPELPIIVNEIQTYEEEYNANTVYIDNDNWYTTDEKVISEGVTGRRIATASVTYKNGKETGRSLVGEVILEEAQSAVIERGTKIPPTYIKPLRGGVLSSGFGARWGSIHKGVDWACGIGTTVFASSAGVVTRADFSSSYGYVIYINHPDGRQTRYAHLSQLLVSAGETVSQGEKIALSGNTGNSTGPHVHFEILIGGAQVNPLKYLK